MLTGENFIIELVYFITVTRMHSALICSKIQVYEVIVEYSN